MSYLREDRVVSVISCDSKAAKLHVNAGFFFVFVVSYKHNGGCAQITRPLICHRDFGLRFKTKNKSRTRSAFRLQLKVQQSAVRIVCPAAHLGHPALGC